MLLFPTGFCPPKATRKRFLHLTDNVGRKQRTRTYSTGNTVVVAVLRLETYCSLLEYCRGRRQHGVQVQFA